MRALRPFSGNLKWASWGEWDLKFLRGLKNGVGLSPLPVEPDDHFNLKVGYSSLTAQKQMGLASAVEKEGLSFEGSHHRAYWDAFNAGAVLRSIINRNAGYRTMQGNSSSSGERWCCCQR